MPHPRHALAFAAVASLVIAPAARAADPAAVAFFEKSVRPVLVERCVGCHGAEKAKGELRLDTREGVLKGGSGGPVVVPGKPKDSRLVAAVRHADEELKMPAAKLPDREIAALEKWVELGVPWPEKLALAAPTDIAAAAAKHWAFKPVVRPAVPGGAAGFQNPIDRFVAAKLGDRGLSLTPRAGRLALLRRATFDLTGLPPTPDEVEAFENDAAPDAYDKLVDRLLASPRYGERWARHWLDVARYADNKGYVFFEGKEYPWAWTYRDYVIDALNADTPYDRFVCEQLAADLLSPGDAKAQAALGFLTVGGHFLNNTHDIIDDRVDAVTRGLLGLTVTCARCHDHKFDPVPAADYYALYGVFRSSAEPTVPPLVGPPPARDDHVLYEAELQVREKALRDFVTAKHAALVAGARLRAAEYLLAAHAARNQPSVEDFMLIADPGDPNPTVVNRWKQFLADAKKRRDAAFRHWHAVAEVPDAEFAARAPDLLKSVVGGNALVASALADPPKSMKDVAARYGALLADVDRQWQAAVTKGAQHLDDPDAEALRRVLYGPDAPADAPLALDWGFLSLFPDRGTQGAYQKLLRALEDWLAKGPPRAMVLRDAPRPYDPRVFERGNPGRPGEPVPRQFLKVANPQRKPFGPGSGRLDLAREIASRDNPLTARVLVNRVWMHHFGTGIVGTPGDFGLRGDAPTHPELLDWLAAEFVTPTAPVAPGPAWSIKRLHKLIMTSAAYTQASLDRPDALATDSENRLLWRQNRRRLEFEALHDAALAASGQLDAKAGGPSVRLFGGNRRRAVYGYVDRLEFPSLLTTFDVPNPAGVNPQRTSTTVAPQALFLMNGPFLRDAAKKLASLPALQKLTDPAERLDRLYVTVYGRRPSADERKLALAFVGKGTDRWTDLAHGLLMTNEFAFVD
ncbi:PSD1 and planctomycete cytochrome C domain-containing protein [Gemmata sp.]|uniref:PSD1 and planctomycete cytochrome C domain-containing protein n=1 Tax=Gemmata sp. TaxID=1914242 RepID=UPI003F717802